jgi:hypothetical protein
MLRNALAYVSGFQTLLSTIQNSKVRSPFDSDGSKYFSRLFWGFETHRKALPTQCRVVSLGKGANASSLRIKLSLNYSDLNKNVNGSKIFLKTSL